MYTHPSAMTPGNTEKKTQKETYPLTHKLITPIAIVSYKSECYGYIFVCLFVFFLCVNLAQARII